MADNPLSAGEIEGALEVLRRAASSFATSSYNGRALQAARGALVELHYRLARQGHTRRMAEKLDDD